MFSIFHHTLDRRTLGPTYLQYVYDVQMDITAIQDLPTILHVVFYGLKLNSFLE